MADKKATPACWAWPEPGLVEIKATGSDYAGQWMLMRGWHEGRCAICGLRPRRLVEDHDHATVLTRGFLCQQCNVREGYRHGGEYAMYRECNPAVILGLQVVYVDKVTGLAAVPKPALTPEEQEHRFELTRIAVEAALQGPAA